MMNIKEKAHNAVTVVKTRVLPAVASASLAASAVAVNAFAADSDSTSSMYQTMADAFKTGITGAADGIALIFAAVIPIGVGIIGLYSALGAGKKILHKLAG